MQSASKPPAIDLGSVPHCRAPAPLSSAPVRRRRLDEGSTGSDAEVAIAVFAAILAASGTKISKLTNHSDSRADTSLLAERNFASGPRARTCAPDVST